MKLKILVKLTTVLYKKTLLAMNDFKIHCYRLKSFSFNREKWKTNCKGKVEEKKRMMSLQALKLYP